MTAPKSRTLVWNESRGAGGSRASIAPASARPLQFAELDRPASEFLALVPWDGPMPDPDEMPAREFLGWL